MRFSPFLAGLLLAMPLLCPAQAAKTAVASPDFALEVKDPSGQPMPVYSRTGYAKIRPEAGASYAIHLTNKTNERIGVVAAVDGVDPFTGKKAYRGQRLHVIDPGKTLVIDRLHDRKTGWRSIQLDPTRKVGMIDVLSYRENMTYPHRLPWSEALQKIVGGEVRPGTQRGELLWLPPSGAPFRKLSQEPSSNVHLEYGSSQMMSER